MAEVASLPVVASAERVMAGVGGAILQINGPGGFDWAAAKVSNLNPHPPHPPQTTPLKPLHPSPPLLLALPPRGVQRSTRLLRGCRPTL